MVLAQVEVQRGLVEEAGRVALRLLPHVQRRHVRDARVHERRHQPRRVGPEVLRLPNRRLLVRRCDQLRAVQQQARWQLGVHEQWERHRWLRARLAC